MKIAAIIAEYNPFHNGHRLHLTQTRRETGADFLLVIMSGDFVQRGAPAILGKHVRAKMALLGGADAVIELPALYALSSAEFFAGGVVTLLNQLNTVDFLSFGSESGSLPLLEACARILVEKERDLQPAIKAYLKKGISYPAARARAIADMLPNLSLNMEAKTIDAETLEKLLTQPNNILAIEYCKALFASKSGIQPFTIKRTDRGYHNTSLDAENGGSFEYASASALRNGIYHGIGGVAKYMPESAFSLLAKNYRPIDENSFSHLLHYKLLSEASLGFSEYLDCTYDLSDKICKNLPSFTGFSDFCSLLKSKELTYARISRVLMHILLNIKTPEFFQAPLAKRQLFVPYARLLGFRQGSEPLLAAVKKNSAIPLLSKMADARFCLEDKAFALLQQDVYCSCIYEAALARAAGETIPNEWKASPVIV
ncbi:MAG: nucleotidyltransferase family protein [Clostridium sp.]|nr:nucleotidyltransferase family protein [Clostridium sp.]